MFGDHISCNSGLFYVVGIIVKYRDCFQAQNLNHKLGWTLDVIMIDIGKVCSPESANTW